MPSIMFDMFLGNRKFARLTFICYPIAFFIFLFFALDSHNIQNKILAWIVFVIGTLPMLRLIYKRDQHVPILESILIAYVLAFSLPIFFETQNTILKKVLYSDTAPITECLILVIAGMSALLAGFKSGHFFADLFKIPKFTFVCDSNKLYYFGGALCLLSMLPIGDVLPEYRSIMNIVFSADLGIGILSLLYYTGATDKPKKVISLILLMLLIIRGTLLGSTQLILQPVLIWYIGRLLISKKFEFTIIVAVVAVFVLFQPVKLEFRSSVRDDPSLVETTNARLLLFSEIFSNRWLNSDSIVTIEESVYTRTSLLLQTAHVIDWTPEAVPFRYGETYKYMLITLIPRLVWPDKPVAQQANIEFAIDYGVTDERGTETTMFGVGHLGEAYLNFGAFGILPIYFIIGLLTYLPIHILSVANLRKRLAITQHDVYHVNIASTALLMVILFRFVAIGTTVSDTYGGIIQLILVQGAMLLIFTAQKRING